MLGTIKMELPKLNLGGIGGTGFGTGGLGLNLSSIPSGKAKDEHHYVFLCAPYKTDISQQQFEEIKQNANDEFGRSTKLFQLTKMPEQWVLQPQENTANAIPSLAVIDSAYQDLEHLPHLIGDVNYQQTVLTKELDNKMGENEKLLEEKHNLQIENAILEERIKNAELQIAMLEKKTI